MKSSAEEVEGKTVSCLDAEDRFGAEGQSNTEAVGIEAAGLECFFSVVPEQGRQLNQLFGVEHGQEGMSDRELLSAFAKGQHAF
ncbi:hypothetical protein NDU88_006123 [Pleurodeles waltl]|uniref:Uncharacterized protein n=1 Tax=Pleurodeles waltl TaxID=8319 RepID=A0AAV7RP88_PLEWA|nr:hypothetical protein NDU88_006123 [Pleurodeles waltl]